MTFQLLFQLEAEDQLARLRSTPDLSARWKAVCKCLGYLQTNPRHPSLRTHKHSGLHGPRGEDVFEAYAQNQTPGAYRVFWFYGPRAGMITIVAITPHP